MYGEPWCSISKCCRSSCVMQRGRLRACWSRQATRPRTKGSEDDLTGDRSPSSRRPYTHFNDPQKSEEMPKLDDIWSVWLGKSRARRAQTWVLLLVCAGRWERKILGDMAGEPWNPERQPGTRGVYITLNRPIKCGGTKGSPACFGDGNIHSARQAATNRCG